MNPEESPLDKIHKELEEGLKKNQIPEIPVKDVIKEKPHIGQGSFGKVYKGMYNGKPVAIKKLKLDAEASAFDIINEINTVRLCNHPKIPKFYGVWKNSKNYFNFIFEYVNGETLDKCLSKLSDSDKYQVILQICEILSEIHKLNLIHRDVKPGNIMIDFQNGVVDAYLIDFGTGKIATNTVTKTQTQSGTIAYMAPENFFVKISDDNEGSIDISTNFDVWSFGCVMCFILSGGTKPWKNSKHDSEITQNIVSHKKYPIPKTIPAEIIEVIKLCFNYNPNQRISSTELFEKLKALFVSTD